MDSAMFSQPKPTLFQNIRNLNFSGMIDSIKEMNFNWMQMGIFFVIGVLTGFLFKKYFKTLFVWTLCGAGLIAALEYAGFIAIDWNAVQGFIGIAPSQDFDTVFHSWLAWSQVNMSLLVCWVVGFMVGHKAA